MGKLFRLSLGAALVALAVGASPLRAETPKDGLVLADFIDDMISLDPAEVFEFSAAEIQAQIYDRLVTTHPRCQQTRGPGRPELERLRRRPAGDVQDPPRDQVPLGQPADRTGRGLLHAARGQAQPVAGLILTQFGFTPENMAETIKATDDGTLVLTLDKPYAPTFLLYCLTSGTGRWSTASSSRRTRRTATWAMSGSRPTPPARARSSCGRGSPTRAWRWTATPATGAAPRSSSAS